MSLGQPLLQATDLSAKRSWRTVFNHVNLEIRHGERIYLNGENGSGKSTLLQTLVGLHPHTAGELVWRGLPLAVPQSSLFIDGSIAFLPQYDNIFPSLTLQQNILIGATISEAETHSRLQVAKETLPNLDRLLNRMPKQVSAGERQLAACLRVLMHRPDLLVLDEPTAGLAPSLLPRINGLLRRFHNDAAVLLTEQHAVYAESWATRTLNISACQLN
jgi:branched-chain amino acid transport system ATP-binding protein